MADTRMGAPSPPIHLQNGEHKPGVVKAIVDDVKSRHSARKADLNRADPLRPRQ